jgi:hypothetical protein
MPGQIFYVVNLKLAVSKKQLAKEHLPIIANCTLPIANF